MTERIRELAEQAGATLTKGYIELPDGQLMLSDGADVDHTTMDLAKFAELIVRECIGCCEQVISDPVPESVDTWLNGGSQCIQEIKEHFGLGMSVADKKQLIKDLLGVQK